MNLRDALINQGPSLELQRAAADEIARLDAVLKSLAVTHYETQARLGNVNLALQAAVDYEAGGETRDAHAYETLLGFVLAARNCITKDGP